MELGEHFTAETEDSTPTKRYSQEEEEEEEEEDLVLNKMGHTEFKRKCQIPCCYAMISNRVTKSSVLLNYFIRVLRSLNHARS
jgi:hypothetical protein